MILISCRPQSSRDTNAPYRVFISFRISSLLRSDCSSCVFLCLSCVSSASRFSSCFAAWMDFSFSMFTNSYASFVLLAAVSRCCCSFSLVVLSSQVWMLIWQVCFLSQSSSSSSCRRWRGRQQWWTWLLRVRTNLRASSVIWIMQCGCELRYLQRCSRELKKRSVRAWGSSSSAQQTSPWGSARLVCSMRSTPSCSVSRTKCLRMMKLAFLLSAVSICPWAAGALSAGCLIK